MNKKALWAVGFSMVLLHISSLTAQTTTEKINQLFTNLSGCSPELIIDKIADLYF
jgi:hypothetical protein